MSDQQDNHYRLFGLIIKSELVLPELSEAAPDQTPDVVIRVAETPEQLEPFTFQGVTFRVNGNEYLQEVKEVARYWVRDGNKIDITPLSASGDYAAIRTFLYAGTMAAVLHQRGFLPLHASSVLTPNGAVLFIGGSGFGKSTLSFFLQKHYDYPLISDDVTPVDFDLDGKPIVHAGFASSRLCPDVLDALSVNSSDIVAGIASTVKYRVPVQAFHEEALPVSKIFAIIPSNKNHIKITPLEQSRAFSYIQHRTYRFLIAKGLGISAQHFSLATRLASQVESFKLERPSELHTLPDLAEKLVAIL